MESKNQGKRVVDPLFTELKEARLCLISKGREKINVHTITFLRKKNCCELIKKQC